MSLFARDVALFRSYDVRRKSESNGRYGRVAVDRRITVGNKPVSRFVIGYRFVPFISLSTYRSYSLGLNVQDGANSIAVTHSTTVKIIGKSFFIFFLRKATYSPVIPALSIPSVKRFCVNAYKTSNGIILSSVPAI